MNKKNSKQKYQQTKKDSPKSIEKIKQKQLIKLLIGSAKSQHLNYH